MNKRTISILASAAGLAMALAAPLAATASPGLAAANTVEICPGNTLSTVDEKGVPYDAATLTKLKQTIAGICTEESARANGMVSSSPSTASVGYAVVDAIIKNPSITSIGINAVASSVPKYGTTHTLSCIYRYEPVKGAADPWLQCGGPVHIANTTSSGATSTTYFCPISGSRFHAHAALLNAAGTVKQQDDAWLVAK